MNKTERFDTSTCSKEYQNLYSSACVHSSNPQACTDKMIQQCEKNTVMPDTNLMNSLLTCYARIDRNAPNKDELKQNCMKQYEKY